MHASRSNWLDHRRSARRLWGGMLTLALTACGANLQSPASADEQAPLRTLSGETVAVTMSSDDGSNLLTVKPSLTVSPPNGAAITTINVNSGTTYQTMFGFGGMFTDSDVYNLLRMSAANREGALKALFDPVTGIGYNLLRIPFGSTDWNRDANFYTYDDNNGVPDDSSLSNFSIQRDIDLGHIAVIKQALTYNPNIKVFASVWSPPAWMKTNNSLIGGNFNSAYNTQYARYLRKAISAYSAQGIPLHAVSVQNEPGNCAFLTPVTCWSWQQERDVIKLLRAELNTSGFGATDIWAMDHNFDMAQTYAKPILDDATAKSAVGAVAFHDYAGEPSAMTTLHNQYPSVPVLVTERRRDSVAEMDRVMQYLRNWATAYVQFTTVVDDQFGPFQWNGGPPALGTCAQAACQQVLYNLRSDGDAWGKGYTYHRFGQLTKFIQRGAVRIASDYGSASSVTTVVFRNPSGEVVLIAANQTTSSQQFKVLTGDGQITSTIPAKTIATYRWTPASGSANFVTNPGFDAGGPTQTPAGWTTWGYGASGTTHLNADYTEAGGRSGNRLAHFKTAPYEVYTGQTITNLPSGTYTARAWVTSCCGGQSLKVMKAEGFGGTALTATVPNTTAWTQITIPNVVVTTGQLTLGFHTNSPANQWINVDDVELVRQ